MASLHARRATAQDVDSLKALCSEASGDRTTMLGARRELLDPAAWSTALAPVVVVEDAGKVVAFASGVPGQALGGASRCNELVAFVTASARRRAAGRAAVSELISVSRVMGLWKLVGYALPENAVAKAFLARLDFREVGVLAKHVQIAGAWRDVALHERLVMASRRSSPSFSEVQGIK
jgi:L-amino acid N-acyltransferase YncA